MEPFQLFFSCRTEDNGRVAELKAQLRDLLPHLPFEDAAEKVPFVNDWRTIASSLIGSCDGLVCLVGPTTVDSENVDWEIRETYRLNKPLVVTRTSPEYLPPPCCMELRIPVFEWDVRKLAGRIGELLVVPALFRHHDWTTGQPTPEALWNQYSLMVQSWEALITRRQTVNTLYISACAALLAGVGAIAAGLGGLQPSAAAMGAALLAVVGAAFSYNWRRTLISYGLLSSAKAAVVAAFETFMPARVFEAEWSVLEAKRYTSTTQTDKQTALGFMLLFIAVVLIAVGIAIGTAVMG